MLHREGDVVKPGAVFVHHEIPARINRAPLAGWIRMARDVRRWTFTIYCWNAGVPVTARSKAFSYGIKHAS